MVLVIFNVGICRMGCIGSVIYGKIIVYNQMRRCRNGMANKKSKRTNIVRSGVKKTKILGYCHFNQHKGYITPEILKEHNCIEKGCRYFNKYDTPKWKELEEEKIVKKILKFYIKKEIATPFEEFLKGIKDFYEDLLNIPINENGSIQLDKYIEHLCSDYVELTESQTQSIIAKAFNVSPDLVRVNGTVGLGNPDKEPETEVKPIITIEAFKSMSTCQCAKCGTVYSLYPKPERCNLCGVQFIYD